MKKQIKPGMFGKGYAADTNRRGFDLLNSQVLYAEKRPDILFVGDSITNWWDLDLYFGDLGYIVNRGIGGDTTEGILKRSDADVFQLEPKSVVYMAGVNDIISICPDLWNKEPGADKATVIKNILANIEAFILKCEGIKLYICSVTPLDMCIPFNLSEPENTVAEVNEGIKELCLKHCVPYVDYHSALKNESDNRLQAGLSTDGVHPEGQAYTVMAKILRKALGK